MGPPDAIILYPSRHRTLRLLPVSFVCTSTIFFGWRCPAQGTRDARSCYSCARDFFRVQEFWTPVEGIYKMTIARWPSSLSITTAVQIIRSKEISKRLQSDDHIHFKPIRLVP